jgi:hypothetical protein
MLFTSLNRAYASTARKNHKLFAQEEIEKKLTDFELEQFSFLAKKFSQWINSPNRDLE